MVQNDGAKKFARSKFTNSNFDPNGKAAKFEILWLLLCTGANGVEKMEAKIFLFGSGEHFLF